MGTALTGTWKLVSCFMEDAESGERTASWGERPNGYLVLTPEPAGRWIVIQTAEGRKTPLTDDDRAAAFRLLLAYSGKYRADRNTIVITVDIAWDESWIGRQQVRNYRIDGDRLHIEAPPQPYAGFGGKVMRDILVWARE